MATRGAGIVGGILLLSMLTVLTVPGAAQEGTTFPPGSIYLTEAVEVKAGERLTIGPGTSFTGPGNITVWGTLLVNGTAGSPAEFSVQVRVLAGGRAEFRQAQLKAVNDTALEVFGGDVTMDDVLLESNTRAALVKGDGRFVARDVVFREHAGEALYVEESADVTLERVTFSGNGRGATVYSARAFRVDDSTFIDNGQHLVIDLGPWSRADAEIMLRGNAFRAPSPTPAQLPSIVMRYDPTIVDESAQRRITLASNRIEGAAVGIRIEGRGLVVDSTNDTLVDNAIGLSVQQATVRLVRPTLGNDRDVEGSGRVTLDDPTYLRAGTVAPAAVEGRASWWLWALGGVLLASVLVGGAVWVRRRLAPAPAPVVVSEPAPLAPPAPSAPDLSVALTALETRILEDILAHPGTAQRAIADRLGYTRQALHYHVKKLEARGLVLKSVEGRETRCEVPPAVASLVLTRTGSHEKG